MTQLHPTREAGRREERASKNRSPIDVGSGSTRLGNYLKRLREGYGYTLRKVEEHAIALGEAIDNSQLSRFEKGKAVPSFEKLRALARLFNVPVQSFSDVLDLEEYQSFKPEEGSYAELLRRGLDHLASGHPGQAFVTYERALELAESVEEDQRRHELSAEARWRMALSLKALGKHHMTERELREILKSRHHLAAGTQLRTTMQLSRLYSELGEPYLAGVLARESLDMARACGDVAREASALNTLGTILQHEAKYAEASQAFERSLGLLEDQAGHEEMRASVLVNLGGCLVALDRVEDGLQMLLAGYERARRSGFRRIAALALTHSGVAEFRQGNCDAARQRLSESDTLASRVEGTYHDMLFLNAYHRWRIERDQGNGTGERIAFGRLRHLRSMLQRRFPEVDAFDRHVKNTRR